MHISNDISDRDYTSYTNLDHGPDGQNQGVC